MPPPGAAQRAEQKFIVFENFEKMNTQSVRQALSEKELAWLENLQPIAGNNLTTVPAPLGALTAIAETITSMFFANLGTVDYLVAFTSVGSGWAINLATAAATQFAPDGTFTAPDMTVWQSQYVLINDALAGYSVWNGTLFVRQGGVSPLLTITEFGTAYASAPTVTITGGTGHGATAVATVSTPGVVSVSVITPGSGYATPPVVVFTGGGGTGASATANIDPRGVTSITITAPGNYATAPTVVFTGGGGTGAAATAIIGAFGNPGIVNIIITSAGSGYSSPPTISFTGGGGTGGGAATCTVGDGRVTSIVVTGAGSNYTSAPSVSFTGGGGGSGVTAAASIGGSGITSLTLTSPGAGYSFNDVLTVVFTGPAGVNADSLTVTNAGEYTGSGVTVVFTGGGGTGAAATAVMRLLTNGHFAVDHLVLTNPGSGYTSAPAISFSGGTPVITPATATCTVGAAATAHVWPFVPAGTTLAVFGGRVWLGGARLLQYTGTQGFDDFNVANASGSLTISDADLVHAITALRNFNNYLWIMGDQSVKQIGNISLNASGNVTLFTILTLSSDQGTIYPLSCASYNRVFLFANTNGIYAVFGSSVQKISDDMDGIFKLVDFTQQPQAALADINNIHNIMYLLRYKDPLSTTRSILLTFTGKKWFVISQGNAIKTVTTTSTLASGRITPYASSGTDLTPMLGDQVTPVAFKIQSSLTHHGNAVQRKKTIRQGYAITAGGTGTINLSMDTDEGSQPATPTIVGGFQTFTFANPNVSGTYLGMTITGTLAGFIQSNMRIEYQEMNIGNQH